MLAPLAANPTMIGLSPSRFTRRRAPDVPSCTVDRYQRVVELERCLGPNEDIAHPTAETALPFRAETVDIAPGHTNRSGEFAGLPFEPPSASKYH